MKANDGVSSRTDHNNNNSYRLLSTYCVAGTILSSSYRDNKGRMAGSGGDRMHHPGSLGGRSQGTLPSLQQNLLHAGKGRSPRATCTVCGTWKDGGHWAGRRGERDGRRCWLRAPGTTRNLGRHPPRVGIWGKDSLMLGEGLGVGKS